MTEQDKSVGLRARLVAAGVELLALEGVHALTLREIARQAGVSHGAPRRYFAAHAELLAAIAGHGFGELATALGLDAPSSASASASVSASVSAAAAGPGSTTSPAVTSPSRPSGRACSS